MGLTWKFIADSLLGMIYPRVCDICGCTLVDGEDIICTACNLDMPRVGIHTDSFNEMHKRLACHCPIERAGALFYYIRDNRYTQLIHHLKYHHRRDIGVSLGKMVAGEFEPDKFFDGIDQLLPVPIHWTKKITRGYNQTQLIADGISEITGIPTGDNIVARRSHSSQTRKGAAARWVNSDGIYDIDNPRELDGLHVLVIDDVITTGSTMVRCLDVLHDKAPTAKVSVLSIGLTKLQ